MRHDTTINYLKLAEAIASAELYVTHSDNKGPSFGFRLWDGLSLMTRDEADKLEAAINDATKPIRDQWKRQYEDRAQECFARIRGLGL